MKKISKYFFALLFCLLFGRQSYSQSENQRFENITLEDGLSQSVVLDIVQDSTGFLWIATQDGLNRYGGKEFKIFKYIPSDSTTIPDNWINALAVGNDTTLWIGTFRNGLSKLNLNSYRFSRIKLMSGGRKISSPVTALIPYKNYLFVTTLGSGLFRINLKTNRSKQYSNDEENTNPNIRNYIRSALLYGNNLWLGTGDGLIKYNIETETFTGKLTGKLSDSFILSLMKDSKGNIWFGVRNGFYIYNPVNEKLRAYTNSRAKKSRLSDKTVVNIFEDSYGYVWLGTWKGGVNKTKLSLTSGDFDYSRIKFDSFKHSDKKRFSIPGNYVRKIFEDKSKLLWIGLWGNSLAKTDLKPPKFKTVTSDVNNRIHTSHSFVRAFTMDKKGRLWVGTAGGGLDIFNKKLNKFDNHTFENERPNSIGANRVYSLETDSDGNIWAGLGDGFVEWDSGRNRFRFWDVHKDIPGVDKHILVNGIALYKKHIIISSNEGLFIFDKTKRKFSKLRFADSLRNINFNKEFTCMKKGNGNNLWIGTYKSFLYMLTLSGRKNSAPVVTALKSYSEKINDRFSGRKRVNDIYAGSGNFVWVSTSLGLVRLNTKTDSMKVFTEREGMPNNICYAALEDDANNIWVSTNRGLAKLSFVKNKFRIKRFDASDGLQGNEFNQSSSFKAPDGTLYFGGINGYSYFNPEQLKENSVVPQTVITGIKIFNKEIPNLYQVLSKKQLTVDYSEKMLTFDFASLEFSNPGKNRFAYKLEGFDNSWINIGNKNSAIYTNLYPGRYRLKIKSSNNDNIWGKENMALAIVVNPPFWMTWWFILLMIILIASVILAVYNYRVNRLLEMERLRTKIASDLHDEVGSLLTQISISADLIKYDSDISKIKGRGGLIRNKSREIMSAMSDVIWSIDARNDKLENLIDRMQDFASSLISDKDILLSFNKNIADYNKILKVDFRQNVFLIFKEAINNAVKYSECDKIFVRITYSSKEFTMEISDNGIGLDLNAPGKGNGLKNMKMRAEKIGAELELINKKGLTILLKSVRI